MGSGHAFAPPAWLGWGACSVCSICSLACSPCILLTDVRAQFAGEYCRSPLVGCSRFVCRPPGTRHFLCPRVVDVAYPRTLASRRGDGWTKSSPGGRNNLVGHEQSSRPSAALSWFLATTFRHVADKCGRGALSRAGAFAAVQGLRKPCTWQILRSILQNFWLPFSPPRAKNADFF